MNRLALVIVVFISVMVIGGVILYFTGAFSVKPGTDVSAPADIASCKIIQDQNTKDLCYFDVAVSSRNVSICGLINETWKKGDCYTLVRAK
jgi:hypothetical protein